MRSYLLLLVCLVTSLNLSAQLRLANVFDDHMVIQRNTTVPIWGWAHPSQPVTINVSWDTTTFKTRASNTTFWKTEIKTPDAGGPHTITIKAGNVTRTLQDVLSGEVWLASGQSNMEWSMNAAADGKPLVATVNDPNIRLFHVPRSATSTPQVRGEGEWTLCNNETVGGFSAVAYFFGKKLQEELGVPVGLIHASWGGAPAEAWTSEEKVNSNDVLREAAGKLKKGQPWCPAEPGVMFNSMINPLIPFRLAGALWYQGETNVGQNSYKMMMETLIKDWREKFETDFPFYYVQIAPYSGYGGDSGARLREQQVKMTEIPKTGMVVVTDLVDDIKDIHPRYKKTVGERLANYALADTYGKQDIAYKSPLYKSIAVEKNKVRITFDNVLTGLKANGEIKHFMVAGDDQKFYPAKAKIEKGTVVVTAKEVKKPVAVRYAWGSDIIPDLFSNEGLPVPAFRSDEWK